MSGWFCFYAVVLLCFACIDTWTYYRAKNIMDRCQAKIDELRSLAAPTTGESGEGL